MATVGKLEDHVICPICQSIYKNPQELTCRHVVCRPCIVNLGNAVFIKCPECHVSSKMTDLRVDVKTEMLVECYQKQKDLGQSRVLPNKTDPRRFIKAAAQCQMCNIADFRLNSHCLECDQFMCDHCETIHNGISVCKQHTVISLAEEVARMQNCLQNYIDNLQHIKDSLTKNKARVDGNEEDIKVSKAQQLDNISRVCQEYHKQIDEIQETLNKTIIEANDKCFVTVSTRKRLIEEIESDIESKTKYLSDMVKCQDLQTLAKTVYTTGLHFNEDITSFKVKLDSLFKPVTSPIITVVTEENLDLPSKLYVTTDLNQRNNNIKVSCLSYTSLLENRYTRSNHVVLEQMPWQLCLVRDDIWCLTKTCVIVFDHDLCQKRKICHKQLHDILCFTQAAENQILIGCRHNNGIHLLDAAGNYKFKITVGTYCSLYSKNNILFAHESSKRCIEIFEFNTMANKWDRTKQFSLICKPGTNFNKICVTNDQLYISSWGDNCIHVFNSEGKFSYQTNCGFENLENPLICGCDDEGNILVCDFGYNQLKVLNNGDDWRGVHIPDLVKPVDVMKGDRDTLWIISQFSIAKYTLDLEMTQRNLLHLIR